MWEHPPFFCNTKANGRVKIKYRLKKNKDNCNDFINVINHLYWNVAVRTGLGVVNLPHLIQIVF